MKKRHLVTPELEKLAEEYQKDNPQMAGAIRQIIHLLDPVTTLSGEQMTEILHLCHTETESGRQKSINGIVSRMITLITNLHLVHLLTARSKK